MTSVLHKARGLVYSQGSWVTQSGSQTGRGHREECKGLGPQCWLVPPTSLGREH